MNHLGNAWLFATAHFIQVNSLPVRRILQCGTLRSADGKGFARQSSFGCNAWRLRHNSDNIPGRCSEALSRHWTVAAVNGFNFGLAFLVRCERCLVDRHIRWQMLAS